MDKTEEQYQEYSDDILRVLNSDFTDFTYSKKERKAFTFYTNEPFYIENVILQHLIYCTRALYDYYGLLSKEYKIMNKGI